MKTLTVRRIALEQLKRTVTIWVDNSLNQAVSIQIKINDVQSLTGAIDLGTALSVAAGAKGYRTLKAEDGYSAYITVSCVCSVAPTAGSVTVKKLFAPAHEVKIVDALAITDTAVHDANTDPDKIFIIEW